MKLTMPLKPTKLPRLNNEVPFVGMIVIGSLPPILKRAYYRWRGASIGKNVTLGMFSYIKSPEITIADGVTIAPFTFIWARTRCRIGARSSVRVFTAIDTGVFEMGYDSVIGEQVVIGGMLTPRSSLVIGNNARVMAYSIINPTEPVIIEDEVCIGGGSCLFTHSTWQSMLDGFPGKFGSIIIKRGVHLGWRVFVMPGVIIGEEATVGAKSVVTRSIPGRTLAMGSPARAIKTGSEYIRTVDEEERHTLMLEWLEEWVRFMAYTGWNTEFTQHADDATVRMMEPGKPDVVIIYRRRAASGIRDTAHIVVSLAPINEDERSALNKAGCGWFDVETRECRLISQPLWTELRHFLIRYGVRFAVVNT